LSADKSSINQIQAQCQQEIKELRANFQKNKQQVIDFLIGNTLNIELSIPDVVKGNFSKILK
jgi:hypothetical protein